MMMLLMLLLLLLLMMMRKKKKMMMMSAATYLLVHGALAAEMAISGAPSRAAGEHSAEDLHLQWHEPFLLLYTL